MPKKTGKTIRDTDLLCAIRGVYDGSTVTDDVLCDEESYYDQARGGIRAALGAIQGADLVYERPPKGGPHWNKGADREADAPAWEDPASSYDLLYFALRGEQFEFEGELDEENFPGDGDEPVLVRVPTAGRIGCAVGISILGPFAVIRFADIELAESGSGSFPDIWPVKFNLDGSLLDLDADYEELYLEEGINALRTLRGDITRILGEQGIRVLSEKELNTRVPGLKCNPDRERLEFESAQNLAQLAGWKTISPAPSVRGKLATIEKALFFQAI
jgi:hypothetical protein